MIQWNVSQGSRLEDQRTELPRAEQPKPRPQQPQAPRGEQQMRPRNDQIQPARPRNDQIQPARRNDQPQPSRGTVPDEDFFLYLIRAQGTRMDEQRASVNTTVFFQLPLLYNLI